MKRIVRASDDSVNDIPKDPIEFLKWVLEEPTSLADYEITDIRKFGKSYAIYTRYVGSHEKSMMPEVKLTAEDTGDGVFTISGEFAYPNIEITEDSYYDDVEAFTHRWYDNSKYWSTIFKHTYSRTDYLDE